MNKFLVTETELVKAQPCIHCTRFSESLDCTNPHICLHCPALSLLEPGYDVIADAIQVFLDSVGETWLRFPGITQNNVFLETNIWYIVGKNFSLRVKSYHLNTPLEGFLLTAGALFIHSRKHSKPCGNTNHH